MSDRRLRRKLEAAQALAAAGQLAEATRLYRQTLAVHPGGCVLLAGDLPTGFAEMEWRWRIAELPRHVPAPRWHGQRLNGEAVVIHHEQGFGDTIMMCRYAPMVADRGGIALIVAPPPLHRLLATLPNVELIQDRTQLPLRFFECPMMSLPLAFGTTLETIPAPERYQFGDPAPWADVLNGMPGVRVGLVWAGKLRAEAHAHAADRRRSMQLADMAPILSVPGCSFVSLQLGPPAAQLADMPSGLVLGVSHRLTDWADTAGTDQRSGPGHQRGHGRRPPRRCARSADLVDEPGRYRLAVDA